MKIMVCGSIGFGGVNEIRKLYHKLENEGFEVLNHIDESKMDYSSIDDFAKKTNLAKKIVEHDLRHVQKADVIVVLSDGKPSYGTGIECYVGKNLGKKIILFGSKKIPTPFLRNFSDFIIQNEKDLYRKLRKMNDNSKKYD